MQSKKQDDLNQMTSKRTTNAKQGERKARH